MNPVGLDSPSLEESTDQASPVHQRTLHHPGRKLTIEGLKRQVKQFLLSLHHETQSNTEHECDARYREICREIDLRGTYMQTPEELLYGARVAWRNSTRCVGRHYWQSLKLLDFRSLETAERIFEAIVDYVKKATNGGRIQPYLAVFAPPEPGRAGIRIWNEQLIRYAGYKQPNGSVLGDPRQVELTDAIRRLGWRGGRGTRFDVLPLVIQMPGESPRLFEFPEDSVLEVEIEHPAEPRVAELGLRWHVLPAIASMRFEVGGVSYTAAPFNGWYLGTEIGARNLADVDRYDQLPAVARCFDFDTSQEKNLWRDRALIELNHAVLYSFERNGIRMVDHHTVSEHFLCFEERERKQGRSTYANWAWVVPPISGSLSPLFHRPYEDVERTPNFFSQPEPWRKDEPAARSRCPFMESSKEVQGVRD